MLASSLRVCLRAAPRPCTGAPSAHRPTFPLPLLIQTPWHAKRVFAHTPRHRKDHATARTAHKEAQSQSEPTEDRVGPPEAVIKQEAKREEEEGGGAGAGGTPKVQKSAQPAAKNDPLLAEQTLSNKEQRKADWAIIKDMSKYLWPKNDFSTKMRVGLSVGLLVGAKVGSQYPQLPPKHSIDRPCRSSMCKSLSTSKTSLTL